MPTNLKEVKNEFYDFVNSKQEIVSIEDLNKAMMLFDNFIDSLCEECENMNKGLTLERHNYIVMVRQVCFYKYDKSDNLIVCYYTKLEKHFKEINGYELDGLRISDYEPIFQTYLKHIPLWKKVIYLASFCKYKKILSINN